MKSSLQVSEILLIDGEKVLVRLGSVLRSEQVFVRLSESMLAGIVNNDGYSGVYVWKKEDEIYECLGDLSLHEKEDGRVLWNIFTNDTTREGKSIAYCQHNCFYSISPTHVRIISSLKRM